MRKFENCWVVIPARGGSKGIPLKNLQRLWGESLIGRSIRICRNAGFPVVVSTDSDEIGREAEGLGACVVKRPDNISCCNSRSEDAVLHALESLQRNGEVVDIVLFVQCTSPFLKANWLVEAATAIQSGRWDAAFTVYKQAGEDFQWRLSRDGSLRPLHKWVDRRPRQQLDFPYRENGALYSCRLAEFQKFGTRFGNFGGKRIFPIVVGERESFQIDTPEDLEFCRSQTYAGSSHRLEKLESYKFLVFDFDGVFTDNSVFVDGHGSEIVRCSRADSWGLTLLRRTLDRSGFDWKILIASTEKNPLVKRRADKLGISCYSGLEYKAELIEILARESGVSYKTVSDSIIFCGNDTNDLEVLRLAAYSIVPRDAHIDLICEANLVLKECGGDGFVRAVTDLLRLNIESITRE